MCTEFSVDEDKEPRKDGPADEFEHHLEIAGKPGWAGELSKQCLK